ncbi:hypothetical protein [Paenibacillus wynnii]|uniref:hypothetical protein n=1 Tax=Paenibacillus wynnii TaxID=268407 RepID=UPI002790BF81|nr:hypothetical protein [Paenibacillus wynnii]MDQ0196638.1 hypothetical protein [Paenibacillus wynnii]
MGISVYLSKPCMELRTSYLDFYQEWIHSGEDIVPWVVEKEPTDFAGMLQFLTNCPEFLFLNQR